MPATVRARIPARLLEAQCRDPSDGKWLGTSPKLRQSPRGHGTVAPVLLTYVDESHSSKRYYVAGLAVHHDSVRDLENALHLVVQRAVKDFGVASSHAELHGHRLFHGQEDWEDLLPRQRIAVYGWALDAIAAHEVKVFLRGVDRPALTARYVRPQHPHDVCLQHLLERVDGYAQRTAQAALVIADELNEHERRRSDFRTFKEWGTPGYLSSTLPRIVDTIHFAPSHHSRLLQAVDLIAYLRHRMLTQTESDPRATRANETLWAKLAAVIEHERTWYP